MNVQSVLFFAMKKDITTTVISGNFDFKNDAYHFPEKFKVISARLYRRRMSIVMCWRCGSQSQTLLVILLTLWKDRSCSADQLIPLDQLSSAKHL